MDLLNRIIIIIFVCLLLLVGLVDYLDYKKQKIKEPIIIEQIEEDTIKVYNNPKDDLYRALIDKDVKFPDIVYAQAILETGYFTSSLCVKHNNLFGLYNSKQKEFFKFNHWTESIDAYINMVQYKYKCGEDYFDFLDRINYAEDPLYNSKLKMILENESNLFKGCTQ